MGRPARGNIERDANGKPVAVRVTLKTGEPLRIKLEPGCTEAQAQTDRAFWAAQAAAGMKAPEKKTVDGKTAAGAETVEAYAKRWVAEREARGLTSASDDRTRLAKHVLPILGPIAMAEVTATDIERVVEHLDSLTVAASSGERDDLGRRVGVRGKTAVNIFGVVTKMFDDARHSKKRELRVLTENPAVGVRGPDRGVEREGPYLLPTEAVTLLSCEDVGLRWRSNYAVAMYTGMRRGELVTLRAADVKLEEGYITVAKAHSRATGGEKGTKTNKVRKVPIEPALKPLLEALVKRPQGSDGRLLDVHATHSGAEELRKHAARAGLTRDDIFANDEQRRPLDFHDLRHTYATWLALAGVDVMVIKQRGGWKDLETVQRYVEEAEAVGRGNIGTPFPALPASLLTEAARVVSEGVSENLPRNIKKPAGKMVGRPGLEPEVVEEVRENATFSRPERDANAETMRREGVSAGVSEGAEGKNGGPPDEPGDAVERALVAALGVATQALDLGAILAITTELRERRLAAAGNVVDLSTRRGAR